MLFSATSTGAVMGLGFVLGLKHAVEADHLAAVSTIVTERRSLWSSTLIGGLWGLGHTISLVAAGVLVLMLDFQISERTEQALEFCVGIMLTLLGLNVFRKLLRGDTLHMHSHEHGDHAHVHPHTHEHEHSGEAHSHHHGAHSHTHDHEHTGETHSHLHEPHSHHHKISPRALIIGMIHGLAGSAALMLLVIPTIESKPLGLLYIIIFGIGSIGGMMIMSFLVGLPFTFTANRFNRLNHLLQGAAGLVSVVLGLMIVYEKGFTERLFV